MCVVCFGWWLLDSRSEIEVVPFLLVAGVLVFGILVLLQLDWLVNHTFYSYNLVFSLDWAVPYWTFLRIVFGSIFVAVVAVSFLGYVYYRRAKRRSLMPVYVCNACGSVWTGIGGGTGVEGGGKSSRLRFLRSCPRCNKRLLAD